MKIKGKVSFINYEKKYAIIEYEHHGKKKTVNGSIDDKTQKKHKAEGLIHKTHQFSIGDVVEFTLKISDRGDRMIATNIQFLFNTSLDVLINKARTDNKFLGYLKIVDEAYFVKEIDTYLFFPVPLSPWQIKPTEQELNEQVTFSLENTDKKEKITASLLNNEYIPEFYTAVKLFKSGSVVDAEITRKTPHGIYLNIVGDKIQAKIQPDKITDPALTEELIPGNTIKVKISYLSKTRIAVVFAGQL